jgi:hypothetical protein
VRAALAVAGAIVGLIVAAVFEAVGHAGLWQILIAVAALGCSFGVAVYHYARLRRLYGNYLESLQLFAVVQGTQETARWIP